jgi:hypothetical protein
MYESEYLKLPVSAFASPMGMAGTRLIGLPILSEVPGAGWLAITEADMRGNEAMYLSNPGPPGRSRLKAKPVLGTRTLLSAEPCRTAPLGEPSWLRISPSA